MDKRFFLGPVTLATIFCESRSKASYCASWSVIATRADRLERKTRVRADSLKGAWTMSYHVALFRSAAKTLDGPRRTSWQLNPKKERGAAQGSSQRGSFLEALIDLRELHLRSGMLSFPVVETAFLCSFSSHLTPFNRQALFTVSPLRCANPSNIPQEPASYLSR